MLYVIAIYTLSELLARAIAAVADRSKIIQSYRCYVCYRWQLSILSAIATDAIYAIDAIGDSIDSSHFLFFLIFQIFDDGQTPPLPRLLQKKYPRGKVHKYKSKYLPLKKTSKTF